MKCTYKICLLITVFSLLLIILLSSCNDSSINEHLPNKSNNSVYAYNLNGVAEYIYDGSKLVEVLTLDPTTLNPFVTDSEKDICKYIYNDDGIIEKLYYFGIEFLVEPTAENNVYSAVSRKGENTVLGTLKYSDSGCLLSEEYVENGSIVLKNHYGSDGKPTKSEYVGMGRLDFSFTDTTTYITVTPYEEDYSPTEITIQLDEYNYPKYMMKTSEGAMIGTTWSYDSSGRCIDTLLENKDDSYSYNEEYEIYYDNNGNVSNVNYYIPNSDGEPILNETIDYFYDANNVLSKYVITEYSDEQKPEESKTYSLTDDNIRDITTEYYTDGTVSSIETSVTEYGAKGTVEKHIVNKFKPDMTFVSGQRFEYKYDETGNILFRTIYNYGENKVLTNYLTEDYTVDSSGNVIKVLYIAYGPDSSVLEKEIDEFDYDDSGNVITKTVIVLSSNDDIISKTVTRNSYDENGELSETVTDKYDSDGNIISAE